MKQGQIKIWDLRIVMNNSAIHCPRYMLYLVHYTLYVKLKVQHALYKVQHRMLTAEINQHSIMNFSGKVRHVLIKWAQKWKHMMML